MDTLAFDAHTLDIDARAVPDELRRIRHTLRTWLRTVLADERRVYDLVLAVSEACTNSVEHGHRGDGGLLRVRGVVEGARIRIRVSDSGTWLVHQGPAETDRGRGLELMRSLIPDVQIQTGQGGTVVEFSAPLSA
ncbi:ATP-binding protein [Nocardia sp. NPDC048505]|uniref:ATP-binding protein n=1 Tax=unclassified Nocardia TaxID=2637762 RepID=UPI0033F8F50A